MTEQKHVKLGVGAVVFNQGCVLLVKRKTPPFAEQWAIPGGKVKFGESLRAAAEREVYEETGITIRAGEPIFTFEIIQTDSSVHYVVVDLDAHYISGAPIANDDAADAAWIDAVRIKNLAVNKITRELLKSKYNFPA